MDIRGRGDREVDCSPPRLPPSADNRRCQPSPFACDRRVNGQGIERRLDDAEPLGPAGSLVLRAGDEDAEMQFGERCGADRPFELTRAFSADEHGGIEEGSHLSGEEISDLARKLGEVVVERLRRRRVPNSLQCRPVHPLVWACGPEAGDRAARDGDGEFLARLGPPQHIADVVAEFFLRDRGHDLKVALLLLPRHSGCPQSAGGEAITAASRFAQYSVHTSSAPKEVHPSVKAGQVVTNGKRESVERLEAGLMVGLVCVDDRDQRPRVGQASTAGAWAGHDLGECLAGPSRASAATANGAGTIAKPLTASLRQRLFSFAWQQRCR